MTLLGDFQTFSPSFETRYQVIESKYLFSHLFSTDGDYFGCYSGNFDHVFDITQYQSNLNHSSCATVCADLRYTHFGLSNGTFCYCGFNDSLNTLQTVEEADCQVFCAGSVKCGGVNTTAVYEGMKLNGKGMLYVGSNHSINS